jgi:hypothetical protein
MPNWDEDSEQLRANLRHVLAGVRKDAGERVIPTVAAARKWQSDFMHGLTPPDPKYVGKFRGEPGLEDIGVRIGKHWGVAPGHVAEELKAFEIELQKRAKALDEQIAPEKDLTAPQLAAVIDLCAWAHSEWVRIHPFANGNGRTARLWANAVAMRYGLPPFVRLRPRPDAPYEAASDAAMEHDWKPMAKLFLKSYLEAIKKP